MLQLPPRPAARAGLVLIAAVSYGAVWAALTFGLQTPGVPRATGSRLAASVLPAFAMLVIPAAIGGRRRPPSPTESALIE
jgi:hypothetical protein